MANVKTPLREKLARFLKEEAIDFHPDLATDSDWLHAADSVLAYPEIKDALQRDTFMGAVENAKLR